MGTSPSTVKSGRSIDDFTIPITVWENVFEQYCIGSHAVLTNWDSTGPWLLSHVCHTWRSIALSTPSLWSEIMILCYTLYHNSPKWKSRRRTLQSSKYHESVQKRLECQLLRSRRAPLHVTCMGGMIPGPHDAALLPLLRLLIKESDRWGFVKLVDITPHPFREIFMHERLSWSEERRNNPYPTLHFLNLADNTTLCDVFDYPAPKLRCVSMSANDFDRRVADLKPMGQVTECHLFNCLAHIATPVLVRIRDTIEDLRLLEIDTSRESWRPEANQGSHIRLDHLRRLRLDVVSKPRGLLQLIVTPVLEDLSIIVRSESIISHITDMLVTSDCARRLKTLRMTQVLSKPEDLIALLQLLSSLDNLELTFRHSPSAPSVFEHIVNALGSYTTAGTDGGIILSTCPRLKNLSLQPAPQDYTSGVGRLADTIGLRRSAHFAAGSLPLEHVTLHSITGWSDEGEAEKCLMELEREGLKLKVLSDPVSRGFFCR